MGVNWRSRGGELEELWGETGGAAVCEGVRERD